MKKLLTLFAIVLWASVVGAKVPPAISNAVSRVKGAPALEIKCTLNGRQAGATLSGNMFILDLGNAQVYYDGKTQWSYLPDEKEVTVFDPSEAELAESNPLQILAHLGSDYSGLAVTGKPDTYRLTALNPKNQINEVTVVINPHDGWPTQMTLIAGNRRIQLANFRFTILKTKKPAEAFRFKAPKGTTVNDLR